MTVLDDFDTPPDPPKEELENVLELKPPSKLLPNPFEKKSSCDTMRIVITDIETIL